MDQKFNQFLQKDIQQIEEHLQQYAKKSPRFHVHQQMQQAYLNFCDRAKQIFQKTAQQLLNTLSSIDQIKQYEQAHHNLWTELNQVRHIISGNNQSIKVQDHYKAIQEVGSLRAKLKVFIQNFNDIETLKTVPQICFDEGGIQKLIYIDHILLMQEQNKMQEVVFNRFVDLKLKENWTVGPGRIDAIKFKFGKKVQLTGFNCFDNKNSENYGIKYSVFVNGKSVIEREDEEYPISGSELHQTHVTFKNAVDVQANDAVDIAMEYTNYGDTYCCRGLGLREGKEKGKDDFISVEKSELDQNCTKHDIGQIPSISYIIRE